MGCLGDTCCELVPAVSLLERAQAYCASAAVEIPHVNDCNYCQKCHLDASSAASSHHRRLLQQQQQLEGEQELQRQRRLIATYQGQRALLSQERGSSSADADGTLPDPAASARWELVGQEASARAREAAVASGIPGAIHNPAEVLSHLIRPHDHESKQLKPNCTECYGCSSTLEDMHAAPVEAGPGIGGLAFMHGKGATNGWLLFGRVPGSSKRYIVKVGREGGGPRVRAGGGHRTSVVYLNTVVGAPGTETKANCASGALGVSLRVADGGKKQQVGMSCCRGDRQDLILGAGLCAPCQGRCGTT